MSDAQTPAPEDKEATFIDAEPAQPVGTPERPTRGDRARSTAYGSRFTIVYLALALVAGIGVGAFFVQMSRPDPAPPAKWSTWQPTGSDTAQARQIATRVAKSYRLENGQQLAAAIVSPPRITSGDGDVPVSTIAIRPDTSTGQNEEGEFDVIPTDKSLQFVLCGLGTGCSIASGVASEERQALLRREALELALPRGIGARALRPLRFSAGRGGAVVRAVETILGDTHVVGGEVHGTIGSAQHRGGTGPRVHDQGRE